MHAESCQAVSGNGGSGKQVALLPVSPGDMAMLVHGSGLRSPGRCAAFAASLATGWTVEILACDTLGLIPENHTQRFECVGFARSATMHTAAAHAAPMAAQRSSAARRRWKRGGAITQRGTAKCALPRLDILCVGINGRSSGLHF